MKMSNNLALKQDTTYVQSDQVKKLTCLLVEDERFDRMNFKHIVARSELSLEIIEATNSSEAREILNRGGIEIVFLDNNLPDGLGLFLTRELKNTQKFANLPIVMISGAEFEDTAAAAKDAGCVAMLTKNNLNAQTIYDVVQTSIRDAQKQAQGSVASQEDVAKAVQNFASDCVIELNGPVLKLTRLSQKLQKQLKSGEDTGSAVTAAEIDAVTANLQIKLNAMIQGSRVQKLQH